MIKVGIRFEPRSVARTQAAFGRVRKYATTGTWNMMNRLANYFAFSAEKATPIGKKRRPISVAKGREEMRIQGGFRYGIKVFGRSQSKSLGRRFGGSGVSQLGNWWWTNDKGKANQLADIWYRGAAKASWAGIKKKLGMAKWEIASDRLRTVLFKSNWVTFNKTPPKQSIVMTNKLSYMDKVAPGVQSIALGKALARLQAVEKAKFAAGMQVAWKAAA